MIQVSETIDCYHLYVLRTKNKSQFYDGSNEITPDNSGGKKGAIAPF